MTGICGWFGASPERPGEQIGDALAAMAGGLGCGGARAGTASDGGAAAAFRSLGADAGAVARDGLVTAIDGRPRWRDGALADLAGRDGHAAALAEAYRRRGDALLDGLTGEFALAVLDPGRRRALLAIDRMGVGRLCFAEPGDGVLVFGSTADAVAAHGQVGATLREQGIYDYLFFYFSPAPDTVYREQRKLCAGEKLVFEDGAARTAFYWQMPYSRGAGEGTDALGAALRQKMRDAVGRTLEGAAPDAVGAFLSGGLDSSTVCGLVNERTDAPAKCFTIGFDQPGYDEMPYATVTAKHFGLAHHPYYVRLDDLVDAIPRIAAAYDEPFGNSSAVPAFICAREAQKAGVSLMIAGDGGDELFAGNSRYVTLAFYERFARIPRVLRAGLMAPAVRALSAVADNALLRKAGNFLRSVNTPMPERIVMHVPFLTNPPEDVFTADFLSAIDPRGPVAGLAEIYERTPSDDVAQRLMHVDLQRTLADNDLLKVCRMCEIAGIEVRFPFLDEELVTFSSAIPSRILLPDNQLRGFYKAAFRDFLAPETISKPKQGFGLPTVEWMRGTPVMLDMVRGAIERFARRGYMRRDFCTAMIDNLVADGSPYLSSSAWDVLILELWLQERGFRA